jgi:hypothetical protein
LDIFNAFVVGMNFSIFKNISQDMKQYWCLWGESTHMGMRQEIAEGTSDKTQYNGQ